MFRRATASFPRPNDGYFYLDVGATLSLAYEVFEVHNNPLFDGLKPYLGSIRSLSATSTQTPRYLELQRQMGLARSLITAAGLPPSPIQDKREARESDLRAR